MPLYAESSRVVKPSQSDRKRPSAPGLRRSSTKRSEPATRVKARRSKFAGDAAAVPVDQERLLERAHQILGREIGFIHNTSFQVPSAATEILEPLATENRTEPRYPRLPGETPAYFAQLYAKPLLSAEGERYLFRKMNFLKFRANQLRAGLDAARPDAAVVAEIERRLAEAAAVRDEIVSANLRLVVSIARRFVDECNEFDELVSDGNLTLMSAVEKFDYARGFRFSTYATHAIQRDYYRQSRRRRTDRTRATHGVDDLIADAPTDAPDPSEGEKFRRYRRLAELMRGELDQRERYVLTMRLGLDLDDGPQTLQVIGARLGVSKERVRQLEIRAIARLQRAAKAERLA